MKNLKRTLLSGIILLIFSTTFYAQNVGISTSGAVPSVNAIVDLNTGNSYNLGLIIPHVTLGASLTTFSPPMISSVSTKDTGMMVYNMNGAQPVGYYCWNGSSWVSVSGTTANAWSLSGNSGTTVGTNYIGTNDSIPFEIKVNGKQRMMFDIGKSCISAGLGDLAKTTTGHNNDAWGNYALANNTTGNYNSAIGGHTMYSNTSGWGNNAHGHEALYSNTTGYSNSALGDSTLFHNTIGINNTALGVLASYSSISSSSTAAVGDYAGYNNLASRATFMGDSAGYNNTTGLSLMAIGYFAAGSNTTGAHNTAIGNRALQANVTGSGSTALGHNAGYNSNADYEVFIGDSAGYSNTSGIRNTAIGYQSAALTTTGNSNTAIGYTSLYHNILGGQNTAVGYQADYSGIGYGSTAVGYSAMAGNTTGVNNTANGWNALYNNQTGSSNTAIGSSAGYNNTADQNVFVGDSAGYSSTTAICGTFIGSGAGAANTGSYNTSVGYEALYRNTTLNNTALGYEALYANTSGSQNIATGGNALVNNTSGGANTANGYRALAGNTALSGNVAMGDSALHSQNYATGFNSGNIAIGNSALFANNPTSNITGNQNTAIGEYSMRYNSTGTENTANGFSALYGTTTGNNNTALGYNALRANTAGSFNTAIGAGADVAFTGFTNATAIGAGATATVSNSMVFGNSTVTQFQFHGALMPFYSSAYNAGTLGQTLISQGAGVSPQWGAMPVAGGGTGAATYNPNALIFEGPTNTSPLISSTNLTWNSNHNTLIVGTGTLQSQSSANMFGNINSYYQMLLQNTNSGNIASTDLVVQDDQDSTHYGDLGINSSTYNQAGFSAQSPGDVYFYSNRSNMDIGTVNAASNGIDSIKFTCGGLNKSNLTEVMSPAGITTQVHFAADTLVIPVHNSTYSPKYIGEKWLYEHAGDTTECTCLALSGSKMIDSTTVGDAIHWASTVTGFSGTPTQKFTYNLQHQICSIYVNISGISNATTLTFTLPFIPQNTSAQVFAEYTNFGSAGFIGIVQYTAGSNVASCSMTNGNISGWAGLGTKGLNGFRIAYEIQ